MINTRILSRDFEYVEPRTIEEAAQFLADYGDKAKFIAGGTDLLVKMKRGEVHPEVLINIARIPALRYPEGHSRRLFRGSHPSLWDGRRAG